MQAERPIRFLVFGKKKVARKDFDADKQDKCNTADSVKKPDEHYGSTPLEFPFYRQAQYARSIAHQCLDVNGRALFLRAQIGVFGHYALVTIEAP